MFQHMTSREEDHRSDVILAARSILFDLITNARNTKFSTDEEAIKFLTVAKDTVEATLASTFDNGFELGKIHERVDTKFYQNHNLSQINL